MPFLMQDAPSGPGKYTEALQELTEWRKWIGDNAKKLQAAQCDAEYEELRTKFMGSVACMAEVYVYALQLH